MENIDRGVRTPGRVVLHLDAVAAIQKLNIVFDHTLLGIGLAAALRHIPGVEVKALAISRLGAGTWVAVEVIPGKVTRDKVMRAGVGVSSNRLPDIEPASTTAIHRCAGGVIGNVAYKRDVVGGYGSRAGGGAEPSCSTTVGNVIGENDMVHIR